MGPKDMFMTRDEADQVDQRLKKIEDRQSLISEKIDKIISTTSDILNVFTPPLGQDGFFKNQKEFEEKIYARLEKLEKEQSKFRIYITWLHGGIASIVGGSGVLFGLLKLLKIV